MISTSRFAMCESSCARTPSTSFGLSRSQRPVVTHTAACLGDRPVANAFGTGVSMSAILGFGRSAIAQRRSTMSCRAGASSRVTTFAPAAFSASLSEVKYWKNASPSTITSIGASPTFRVWKRTTAKITYSRPRRPLVRIIRAVRPASRPYDLRFMWLIVGVLTLVPLALNGASTARAADSCVVAGTHELGARGFVVARPGHSVLEHITVAAKPCGTTFWVDPRGGPLHALTVVGPGWSGTVSSSETRIDGLVGSAQLRTGHLHGGGHADLQELKSRLDRTRASVLRTRILLAAILIALALFAPRRAVVGGAAAVSSALVLSAFGSTSLTLFALLTLVGALAPWRALWVFFAVYLVVLVVSPETQSLALLGPHPWGAGRFYGVTNELETLLLAPALVLGVLAAPLTLLAFGWSRAGADGGGVLVLLSSYTVLLLGVSPRRLAVAASVAV